MFYFSTAIVITATVLVLLRWNRRRQEAEQLEESAKKNGKEVIRYARQLQRNTGSFPEEVADHLNQTLKNPAGNMYDAVTDLDISLPCICVYTQLDRGRTCRVDVRNRWGNRILISFEAVKEGSPGNSTLTITPDGKTVIIRRPDGSHSLLSRLKGPGEGVWSTDDFPPK